MSKRGRLPLRRTGFTLVELLVVIALILAVTAIGVGYVVFGQGTQKQVRGAQSVSGWLLNAKQIARRDQFPTGVRMFFAPDPNAPQNQPNQICAQLFYVQQPAPFSDGTCTADALTHQTLTFAFSSLNVNFTGGAAYPGQVDSSGNPPVEQGAPVQYGDYFTTDGSDPVHLIDNVLQVPTSNQLHLHSPDTSVPTTAPGLNYRIIRAPRRLPGEDILQMPPNVVIDLNLSKNIPVRTVVDPMPAPNGTTYSYAEILFAPNGSVAGQGTGPDKIYLWMRDPKPTTSSGAPLIVTIQTRTGFIGVFPVAPGPDPYSYAKDPRDSGV